MKKIAERISLFRKIPLSRRGSKTLSRRAASVVEYAVLLTILMAAFLIFQKYLVRGFAGRWKSLGDIFGYGLQYEPGSMGPKTVECAYSDKTEAWYDAVCYDTNFEGYQDSCLDACYNRGEWGSCSDAGFPDGESCSIVEGQGCCGVVHILFLTINVGCSSACVDCCKAQCLQRCSYTLANQCEADEKCSDE